MPQVPNIPTHWSEVQERFTLSRSNDFNFTEKGLRDHNLRASLKEPVDFVFLTDSLADMLVTKTNRFSNPDASAHSYQN